MYELAASEETVIVFRLMNVERLGAIFAIELDCSELFYCANVFISLKRFSMVEVTIILSRSYDETIDALTEEIRKKVHSCKIYACSP